MKKKSLNERTQREGKERATKPKRTSHKKRDPIPGDTRKKGIRSQQSYDVKNRYS